MSRVHLTIDRLVLTGIDPGDAPALVEALKAGLAETLTVNAAGLAHSRHVAVARAAAPPHEPGRAGARQTGRATARTIGQEVSR
jgi:hypothetical protein